MTVIVYDTIRAPHVPQRVLIENCPFQCRLSLMLLRDYYRHYVQIVSSVVATCGEHCLSLVLSTTPSGPQEYSLYGALPVH